MGSDGRADTLLVTEIYASIQGESTFAGVPFVLVRLARRVYPVTDQLDGEKFFTEPHYNGFPAVLVRLATVDVDELAELVIDAWRCQAPRRRSRSPASFVTPQALCCRG